MTDTEHSWVEKHRPQTLDDIQGNNKALNKISAWAEGWEPGYDAVLLAGPPGTGKTTTARCVANMLDLPLREINTSSARTSDDIAEMAASINVGDKVVLLDEVDSWHHAANKQPLFRALDSPQNPILMTCNDDYSVPEGLKSRATTFDFSLQRRSRLAYLKKIADREDLDLSDQDLTRLSQRDNLRSAIQDLQIASQLDRPVGEDGRESSEGDEWGAMDELIQLDSESQGASDDVSPPQLLLWLDENISKEWRGMELALAMEALSKADKHIGRAGPGDYRPWRWAGDLIEHLPELRLSDPYRGFIKWEFPSAYRRTGSGANDDTSEAAAFRQLSEAGVVSGSYQQFRKVYLPILGRLSEAERAALARTHGLDTEAAEGLGIDPSKYDSLREPESPEEGEGLEIPTIDAADADW